MRVVEDFETEDQVMANRIKLRKYLRELVVNQKRILAAALDKDYIDKVKEYFEEKKKSDEEKWKMLEEDQKKSSDEEEEYESEEEEKE